MMARMSYSGGDKVSMGSYWNFSTGERIKIGAEGTLPGNSTQSYYKAPPMVILSLGVMGASVLLYALSKYLVQFYEPYAETLIRAYIVFDYVVMGSILACMLVIGIQDILGGTMRTASFTWRPAKAYFAGRGQKHTTGKTTDQKSGPGGRKE